MLPNSRKHFSEDKSAVSHSSSKTIVVDYLFGFSVLPITCIVFPWSRTPIRKWSVVFQHSLWASVSLKEASSSVPRRFPCVLHPKSTVSSATALYPSFCQAAKSSGHCIHSGAPREQSGKQPIENYFCLKSCDFWHSIIRHSGYLC